VQIATQIQTTEQALSQLLSSVSDGAEIQGVVSQVVAVDELPGVIQTAGTSAIQRDVAQAQAIAIEAELQAQVQVARTDAEIISTTTSQVALQAIAQAIAQAQEMQQTLTPLELEQTALEHAVRILHQMANAQANQHVRAALITLAVQTAQENIAREDRKIARQEHIVRIQAEEALSLDGPNPYPAHTRENGIFTAMKLIRDIDALTERTTSLRKSDVDLSVTEYDALLRIQFQKDRDLLRIFNDFRLTRIMTVNAFRYMETVKRNENMYIYLENEKEIERNIIGGSMWREIRFQIEETAQIAEENGHLQMEEAARIAEENERIRLIMEDGEARLQREREEIAAQQLEGRRMAALTSDIGQRLYLARDAYFPLLNHPLIEKMKNSVDIPVFDRAISVLDFEPFMEAQSMEFLMAFNNIRYTLIEVYEAYARFHRIYPTKLLPLHINNPLGNARVPLRPQIIMDPAVEYTREHLWRPYVPPPPMERPGYDPNDPFYSRAIREPRHYSRDMRDAALTAAARMHNVSTCSVQSGFADGFANGAVDALRMLAGPQPGLFESRCGR
jgi:hypothetical protein